ncbi:hypothetical protein [Acaryochloris sp. CCMEE 5410]|uniref:hypothetical protein n=1 Tax=Acaryochloris sp. CCMEE 5410 TaxID=310037 RepID=UPI0002483FD9|nr:hypothetical protein [Acaryochloris sp. CCMEE 5410]KAI9129358.1 hypothetical protein ON05_035125 [Acaryochloris sp. CCMEE 5410]
MEKEAYLTPKGISDVDWANTPESVKRLLVVLLERIEHQEKQLKAQQTEIDWLKEQLHRKSSIKQNQFGQTLGSTLQDSTVS